MRRKWTLVAAGLAVTAAAGSATGIYAAGAAQAPSTHVVAAQEAATPQVQQARVVTPSGQAAFQRWWAGGGYRQYQRAANDLSRLIIMDVLQDDDDTWIADAQNLTADATTASRHLPPVDGAGYKAGMTELAQAGRDALAGSYDKAYADIQVALPKLAAFNTAISGWVTSTTAA